MVSVSADKVDPANDKKPVHLTAEATTEETLKDPEFPVSAIAIRLVRHVEMYQWKEREETKTTTKVGGRKETEHIYHYEKTWADSRIDSDRFKKKEDHANPSMRYSGATQVAKFVRLGAFTLSPALIQQIDQKEPLPFDAAWLKELPEVDRPVAVLDGGTFTCRSIRRAARPKPRIPRVARPIPRIGKAVRPIPRSRRPARPIPRMRRSLSPTPRTQRSAT